MNTHELIAAIEADELSASLLDFLIASKLVGKERIRWGFTSPTMPSLIAPCPPVTTQIDAARAVFFRAFPGWSYRLAECSVSDDAWVIPDFNHPAHGQQLQAIFPAECQRDPVEWFGSDVDLRPPGRPAAAFCIAMLIAYQRTLRWLAEASHDGVTVQ